MSSCISFIFLFLFSFLTSFTASAQKPSFIYHICPNTTTYTRNSTYFTNLQTLLSTLSSRNASYSTGFQNTTVGQAPNRVTGLFLCRGDVSPEICRSCVASSVNDTTNLCPKESEAVLYYDECMLRYSHRNILSTVSFDGGAILLNPQNISSNQVDRFKDLVNSTLNQAAVEGASNNRKFYTRKANWTALESLHAMVQCTPDLTSLDCSSCLQQTINGMPMYRIGGRLLWPSCSIRYELYAFYNETAVTTSSPPSPSPSPSPLPLPSPSPSPSPLPLPSPSPSTPPPTLLPESTPPVSSPPKHGKGGKSGVSLVAMVVPIIVLFCFS